MSVAELKYLRHLNNGQLLEYIKLHCDDPDGADLLKQRWESFWDNDFQTLRRQHLEIDRLSYLQSESRGESNRLREEIKELRQKVEQHESGKKIRALRKHAEYLDTKIARLTAERNELKRERSQTYIGQLEREVRSLEIRLRKAKHELVDAEQRLIRWIMDATNRPAGRNAIQIVPAFETWAIDPCTIACEVRAQRHYFE